jgi:hypothetical protein
VHQHDDPAGQDDEPEVHQPVGDHRGQRPGAGQPAGGQRRGQRQLDQAEPAGREAGAADRGSGAVGEQQPVPRHRLPGGEDSEREGGAVGHPVQDGQPEYLGVAAPREADARDPVEEVLQPGREVLQRAQPARRPRGVGPAGGPQAGQAVQPVGHADQELAQGLADPVVAHGQQHGCAGHQVHGRACESGRGGDGPPGDGPGHQQQGQ